MSNPSRSWPVHLYRIGVGLAGVLILFLLAPTIPWQRAGASLALLALFSLMVKRAGFHIAPNVTHSLVGIVDAAVLLLFGPPAGALVATASCSIYLLLYTWRHQTPSTRIELLEITLFSSGLKALIALGAGAVYRLAGGGALTEIGLRDLWPLLMLFVTWFALDHLAWGLSELLEGGPRQVWRFMRTIWSTSLLVEFFPLWAAVIIVFVYNQGNMLVFWLLALGLIAVSLVVQRLADTWDRLRHRLAELTALSEIGRAIVGAQTNEDDLCELIYRQAGKIVDTAWFHLGLFDGPDYELKISVQDHVRQPSQRFAGAADEGIIGWMRRSRQPLLVHDFRREMNALPARPSYNSAHPPRSGVYVPLLAGDQVIGTLSIQSPRPGAFTPNHLRLLSVIANQAALAIEQVRMYQIEQRRVRQLTLIESVGRKVTSILDLDTLFDEIVRLVQETFGYYHVSILSLDTENNLIRFQAGTDSTLLRTDICIPLGQGIVGWVAAHGEPLLVNDVHADARFIHVEKLADTRAELAVPLIIEGRVLGVLDVQSDRSHAFDQDDLFILQTLASQLAIAIENARLYAAQQEETYISTALLQVSEAIKSSTELDDILSSIVRITPLLIGVNMCAIMLYSEGKFVPGPSFGFDDPDLETLHLALLDGQLGQVVTQGRPALSQNDDIPAVQIDNVTVVNDEPAVLALPLVAQGNLRGAMLVDYAQAPIHMLNRWFNILTGIADQAAMAIENAFLQRRETERERLQHELDMAREIQASFLPQAYPSLPGWQIDALWQSANQVGGDFYDMFMLPDGRWGLVIADVADKGVPAALFMALSRTLIRVVAQTAPGPVDTLARTNDLIISDTHSDLFVTAFYLILDPRSGEIVYANGGHNPPLLVRRDGQIEWLRARGIVLGILSPIHLEEKRLRMEAGDLLVMYTDGVTDAINEQEEEFGSGRLAEAILAARAGEANEVIDAVHRQVLNFSGDMPQFDDLTLVVIKREGQTL